MISRSGQYSGRKSRSQLAGRRRKWGIWNIGVTAIIPNTAVISKRSERSVVQGESRSRSEQEEGGSRSRGRSEQEEGGRKKEKVGK